jgi:osmoprotectant transport system substrate-binding protein
MITGFVSLSDPSGLIASQAVVPLIAKAAATPATTAALDRVSANLTTAKLEQMVKRVEVDEDDPDAVAQQFLRQEGLD